METLQQQLMVAMLAALHFFLFSELKGRAVLDYCCSAVAEDGRVLLVKGTLLLTAQASSDGFLLKIDGYRLFPSPQL
jgi:hypothetical protein